MTGRSPIPLSITARGRQIRVGQHLVAFVMLLIGLLTRGDSAASVGSLPQANIVPVTCFMWFVVVWNGVLPRLTREFVLTVAVMWTTIVVVQGISGVPLDASLRASTGQVVQVCVLQMLYRWVRSSAPELQRAWRRKVPAHYAQRLQWAPTRVGDVIGLMGCAVVATVASLPIGSIPGIHLDGTSSPDLLTEFVFKNTDALFVGGLSMLLLLCSFTVREWRRFRPVVFAGLIAACFLLALVQRSVPTEPVAWVMLLPSIAAGLLLGLWATGAYVLLASLVWLYVISLPGFTGGYDDALWRGVAIALVSMSTTAVAVVIAMLGTRQRQRSRDYAMEAGSLTAVVEGLTDGVVVLDHRGQLLMQNSTAASLLGRSLPRRPDWVVDFDFTDLDGLPLEPRSAPAVDTVLSGDASSHEVLTPAGRRLSIRSWPMGGDAPQTLVVISDVTSAREQVEELSHFAQRVVHDLRTPLTVLEGWLELAGQAQDNDDLVLTGHALEKAAAGSRRMATVMDDWLDYTVQRSAELTPQRLDLAAVIDLTWQQMKAMDSSGATMTLDSSHAVKADPVLVRQLFTNLFTNAIKYSGDRPPLITVSSTAAPGGRVLVEVADRGVGIPPGQEARIFDEFHRVPDHTPGVSGTGLGLAMCRNIVSRRGGEITARSNEHGGASISFTLPAT